MGNELPELTPERIREIWILLGFAGFLIFIAMAPVVVDWWLKRQIKVMRPASQFFCHHCRKGTDWNEALTQCLNCGNHAASSPPEQIDGNKTRREAAQS